jgi:hypothetical protein
MQVIPPFNLRQALPFPEDCCSSCKMYTLAQKSQIFTAIKIKNQKFATKAAQNYALGAVP